MKKDKEFEKLITLILIKSLKQAKIEVSKILDNIKEFEINGYINEIDKPKVFTRGHFKKSIL